MKGIKLCGECGNYDYKKHRCRIGCKDDSDAQAPFYCDCPLPDVVPKSEVESIITEIADFIWQGESEKMNFPFNNHYYNKQEFIAELKKKYTEEKK